MAVKNPITWLKKTQSRHMRDRLRGYRHEGGTTWSTDGAMTFIWLDHVDVEPAKEAISLSAIVPGRQVAAVTISRRHLYMATNAVLAYKPNGTRISFNGNADIEAEGEHGAGRVTLRNGETWRIRRREYPLTYHKHGSDVEFSLDSKRLKKILLGMGEIIEIRVYESLVSFRSGKALAFIMPLGDDELVHISQ